MTIKSSNRQNKRHFESNISKIDDKNSEQVEEHISNQNQINFSFTFSEIIMNSQAGMSQQYLFKLTLIEELDTGQFAQFQSLLSRKIGTLDEDGPQCSI